MSTRQDRSGDEEDRKTISETRRDTEGSQEGDKKAGDKGTSMRGSPTEGCVKVPPTLHEGSPKAAQRFYVFTLYIIVNDGMYIHVVFDQS